MTDGFIETKPIVSSSSSSSSPRITDGFSSYLSRFVKLLFQPRHRHFRSLFIPFRSSLVNGFLTGLWGKKKYPLRSRGLAECLDRWSRAWRHTTRPERARMASRRRIRYEPINRIWASERVALRFQHRGQQLHHMSSEDTSWASYNHFSWG